MRNLFFIIFVLININAFSQVFANAGADISMCKGYCLGIEIEATASGGTPPYTYSWNNGLPPGAGPHAICPTTSTTYTVIITDMVGAKDTDSLYVQVNPIPISYTSAICLNNTVILNGISNSLGVFYSWNNGLSGSGPHYANPTTPSIYTLQIINSGGCAVFDTIDVSTIPCFDYDSIKGRVHVHVDLNLNCKKDSPELYLPNVIISATNTTNGDTYYSSTDSSGAYSLFLPDGNYDITQASSEFFNPICPLSNTYNITLDTLNNFVDSVDFADTLIHEQDIAISLFSGTPRPGFEFNYYLSYSNTSYIPVNGQVYLVVDNSLNYISASLPPNQISGDTLFWNYSNLSYFNYSHIKVRFQVPTNTNLGSALNACVFITPLIGDADTLNNKSCINSVVVGSYDPNDKQVFPTGTGASGNIYLSDSQLRYTIRFQNTGTDTAFNIIVIDTLSKYLNPASIRKVTASHPFTYSISGKGILTFTFNNILLPDSNVDEVNSHGLIQFVIDQYPSNTIGAVIENTAEIYFDYNVLIKTNTVINTIGNWPVGIEEPFNDFQHISLYPNPTDNLFTLALKLTSPKKIGLSLTDLLGKQIDKVASQDMLLQEGEHKIPFDVSNIKPGIYFLSIIIDGHQYAEKLIIK